MTNSALKVKKKKRRHSVDELRAVKEQQRILYLRQRRHLCQRQLVFNRIRGLIRLGSVLLLFLAALYTISIPEWKLSPFIFSNYPNKNLIIEDNTMATDSQILNILKRFNVSEKPIYLLNTDALKKALLKLDPIQKVVIRKYWLPARMKLVIIEKQPLFIVYGSNNSLPKYVIADDASKINKKYLPLPENKNKNTYKIILPGPERKWTTDIVDKYETIIHIAELSTKQNVEYLDLSNPNDIYIKTPSLTIRLGEMDATVIERLSRLKPVYPSIKNLKAKIDYIDLRWDNALSLKEKTNKPKKTIEKVAKSEDAAANNNANHDNVTSPENTTNDANSVNNNNITVGEANTTSHDEVAERANQANSANIASRLNGLN